MQFANATASNSIVVRYSVPDGGADYWATLSVYVNGTFRTKLNLTSRYSWTYGDEYQFDKPWQNDPAQGHAHHFFDEARALVGDIPVGATVMVRKDSGDTAANYDINLIDMEQVPGPKPKPDGYISVSECGATANDGTDDSGALQRCADRARAEGRGLYIPQGVFNSYSKTISVAGITVRGAGMWYSTVAGYYAHFDCWADGCKFYDLGVSGDTTQRLDDSAEAAFGGNGSSGTLLDSVSGRAHEGRFLGGTECQDGVTIRNSRFRDLFADGVNLYGGTSNAIVEHNHARNTGDDSFAIWSDTAGGLPIAKNNVIRHNYVQLPWKASCFGVYGGESNRLEDNVCADTVQFPGVLLARQFNSYAFTGTTQLARNTLDRAGGFSYNQAQGALKVHADQGYVGNISVTDLDVSSASQFALHVQGQNWDPATCF